MRAQSRAGSRRIRLDGVSLIQQAFAVELLQQPPQSLDISVFIRDIRMVQVHPVAHLVGQVGPFLGEFHHVVAALFVVVGDGNRLSDVFLRDAQLLLHAQLDGKSVCVPSGLAFHQETFHRLISAKRVLDGTRHHVVNARHAVGRRRTFIKHKRRTAFTFRHTLGENVVFIPLFQHVFVHL